MSDTPKIVLQPLGDPAAAACEGDVCEIPPSAVEQRRSYGSRPTPGR